MPTRTLEIDLRQGTGAESEPMYGVVTVQRAKAKTTGGFEILPFETSLKLINGKATITEAETDGTGPFYDSVYLFRVQNGYCGHRYGFMAALPDGTTPITTGELPMVDPITGEGIYMDAQEWNALYGDLPDRVSSLESSQATQNTQIASLQTALNTKGNASMRVDTTVGTRVFLNDGSGERMVSGDTGLRNITAELKNGWTVGTGGYVRVRRFENTVTYYFKNLVSAGATSAVFWSGIPDGFVEAANGTYRQVIAVSSTAFAVCSTRRFERDIQIPLSAGNVGDQYSECSVSFSVSSPWPTTLPGTPA